MSLAEIVMMNLWSLTFAFLVIAIVCCLVASMEER